MPIAIISHPDCRLHEMGEGHPEQPARLSAIFDRLIASGLEMIVRQIDAPLATREQLERVILAGFVLGLSTRKVGEALLPLLGERVSPTTVSRVARGLDEAAAVLGRGERPGLLPETGPRELAALARRGVLVAHTDAIETLSKATHVLWDKTGTLTKGLVRIEDVRTFGSTTAEQALAHTIRHDLFLRDGVVKRNGPLQRIHHHLAIRAICQVLLDLSAQISL